MSIMFPFNISEVQKFWLIFPLIIQPMASYGKKRQWILRRPTVHRDGYFPWDLSNNALQFIEFCKIFGQFIWFDCFIRINGGIRVERTNKFNERFLLGRGIPLIAGHYSLPTSSVLYETSPARKPVSQIIKSLKRFFQLKTHKSFFLIQSFH